MDDADLQASIRSTGIHDILIDLLGSLSAVKTLSELDNQQELSEKDLVLNALNILIANQDMEYCEFQLTLCWLEDQHHPLFSTSHCLYQNI